MHGIMGQCGVTIFPVLAANKLYLDWPTGAMSFHKISLKRVTEEQT